MDDDIRLSIRLARPDFFSFSSLVEDVERAVGGGDKTLTVTLELERLLIERARWMLGLPLVCVDGGRDGDRVARADGEGAGASRLIERRRSEKELRP